MKTALPIFLLFIVLAAYPTKSQAASTLTCDACVVAVTILDVLVEKNATEADIEKVLVPLCVKYSGFSTQVCDDIIPEFAPEVIPILLGVGADARVICSMLRLCNGSNPHPPPDIHIPPKPAHTKPFINPSGEGVKVLQLSDVHWDDLYMVGSAADCPNPLCCRAGNSTGRLALKWGDYNCDLTEVMFDAVLEEVSTMDFDFIVWTGDNPPHDVWEETAPQQLARIQRVTAKINKYFPKATVFPAIGNHDTFPVDQYNRLPVDAYHHDDFQWLSDGLVEAWGSWLDDNATKTLAAGGYYTMLVKTGLRVIAVNAQFGDPINFYLFLAENQQVAELQWLADTLAAAELNGEKVIIIGHIPPYKAAPKVLSNWAAVYVELIQRFSDIVVAQFYGHTHEDQFEMTMNGTDPVGVVYIAPSVTTFTKRNPSFRIYEFNTNFTITDYNQYYTNLTAANENDGPTFELLYSAKEAYNLPDLSPASWLSLINNFKTNDTLWQIWYNNYGSNVCPTCTCTGDCKEDFICSMSASDYDEYLQCTFNEDLQRLREGKTLSKARNVIFDRVF